MSALLLSLLLACNGHKDEDSGPGLVGPELAHTPPTGATEGVPVTLTLTATDEDGLGEVTLFHRIEGDSAWVSEPMTPEGDDTFTVTLDGADVDDPALEYYFKAVDAGETPATTYLPRNSTNAPYVLAVGVEGIPLPFVEDFERKGEVDLSQIGWGSASTNFRGYPWDFSDAQAHGGATSAFHPRGYAGTEALKDYLVSPALDFSGVADAQVTWWEYGNDVEDARHALFVSTGSRDPADGDYVKVADLPAPSEGDWGRSAVVDLTAHAGSPTVYLAWYFEGVDADDWWVDDVRVEALQADLSFDWSATPSPVHPGESGTLTVTVTNPSTLDATDATVTVAFPEGGVTIEDDSVTLDSVAGGSSADATFAYTVDASAEDPGYVPVTITVSWGSSVLTEDDRFLVGEASVAHVDWNVGSGGALELSVGVGDPADPTWEGSIFSGNTSTGVLSVDLDITDQAEHLPPEAGAHRWFLRGTTESAGSLLAFTIHHQGVDYAATVLPTAVPESEFIAWLPEPPALSVSASATSEIDPGDTGITVSLSVSNTGAPTAGPVSATLVSADVDATVTDPGPIDLGVIGTGARVGATGFSFDVSAAHVDSSPVQLSVELTDGVETWSFPVSFAVPFPVLRITSIEIDDDGRDGILDPDESADITFNVTNVGDETTSGSVTGTLAIGAASTATATASDNEESFGTFTPGSTRDSREFTVTVDGGSAGDTVVLELSLTDSVRTYLATTTLTLSEPPWQSIDTSDDDIGDALEFWHFDIVSGSYRVVGTTLQIRFQSDAAFDPANLFIEAWGESAGAEWLYYRLVVQSGVADLQGYDSSTGFLPISVPTVSYPDATTVQVDIDTTTMGLFLPEISIGIGTGWCGPPEYYCDQYPDNWGYPYDSVNGFSTANWFSLSW